MCSFGAEDERLRRRRARSDAPYLTCSELMRRLSVVVAEMK
jgi:hypothetical protein